jgi:Zn-dependent protease
MGPIWGLTLALIAVLVYKITGNAFFGAVAGWMAMLNLFNLLPISPLDGGRIMKSIAFSIGTRSGLVFMLTGIVIFTAITIWKGIILFAALLIIASLEFVFTYYDIKRHVRIGFDVRSIKKYAPMPIKNIILSVGLYILVTIALWVLMVYVENIPEVEAAKSIFM